MNKNPIVERLRFWQKTRFSPVSCQEDRACPSIRVFRGSVILWFMAPDLQYLDLALGGSSPLPTVVISGAGISLQGEMVLNSQ